MGGDSSSFSPAREDVHVTINHPHSRRPALSISIPSLSPSIEQDPEKTSGSSEGIDCTESTAKDEPVALIGNNDSESSGTSEETEAPKTPQPRLHTALDDRVSNPPAHILLGGDLPLYNTLDIQPRRRAYISPPSSSTNSVTYPLYPTSRLSPSTPGSTSKPSRTINNKLPLERSTAIWNGTPQKHHLLDHRERSIRFHAVMSRISEGNFGPVLPQVMYRPHYTGCVGGKQYVEETLLEAPIFFKTECPYQEGILLKDALHSRTKNLRDRDQVMFEGRGPSISIRLQWPGYRQWSRQIPTKDFRSPPQPINLAKLAKNVAKCVQRFIQDRKTQPMEEGSDQRWKIGDGPNDIKLENLILVSLHHVSLGSWQPHLRLYLPHSVPAPATPWLHCRL